jgi:hypothetical protein
METGLQCSPRTGEVASSNLARSTDSPSLFWKTAFSFFLLLFFGKKNHWQVFSINFSLFAFRVVLKRLENTFKQGQGYDSCPLTNFKKQCWGVKKSIPRIPFFKLLLPTLTIASPMAQTLPQVDVEEGSKYKKQREEEEENSSTYL